ncbi:MAG: GNAT family N-acetyltransferase [Sneathiellales bacterium]|nr:GNAT family N-acetyltransferase [Sneathiellales bacterium]
MISITVNPAEFNDWQDLLDLVQKAYAYMEARIDPPSSMHKLTLSSIEQKAKDENLILAWEDETLVGCAFVKELEDRFYIGKLAVTRKRQGKGIGQEIIKSCIAFAREKGKPDLELESRIELIENHAFFEMMGFTKTGENTHEGYSRPTSLTFQRVATS